MIGGMNAIRLFLALAAAVACTAAPAQQPPTSGGTVVVSTTRDPVDKSYHKMLKGMERFEREHFHAPRATLRFHLLPRLPNTKMEGITLRVAGNTVSIPVPIAPDNSFTVPRNQKAWDEDAAVLANRKTSSMTWRALVQTPGLPPGVRRLGDLRLECKVGMDAGLVSNTSPTFAWLNSFLNDTDKVCGSPEGNYLFFADRPIFSVTLHAPGRTEVLPFAMLYSGGKETRESLPYCDCQVMLDRSYFAPIWDNSWPDDTLVTFEYMDDAEGVQ